nr:MAG TPA: hypothetical protein [Caudoviricetes sp.]
MSVTLHKYYLFLCFFTLFLSRPICTFFRKRVKIVYRKHRNMPIIFTVSYYN